MTTVCRLSVTVLNDATATTTTNFAHNFENKLDVTAREHSTNEAFLLAFVCNAFDVIRLNAAQKQTQLIHQRKLKREIDFFVIVLDSMSSLPLK